MRTLVVSDLHLGTRLGRDVLRFERPREALLEAVAEADRLVLLGDTVELLEARPRQAFEVARPVVQAIGQALGADKEIVLVMGNHDRALIARWLHAHGDVLGHDTIVPPSASPGLAALVEWLGASRTRVRYPGVWLDPGVWATHGHYLDRHLLPEAAFGLARGMLGRPPRDGATPANYEAGPHITRMEGITARLPPRVGARVDDVAAWLRSYVLGAAPAAARVPAARHLSPVTSWALSLQMRRSALPALGHVIHRLGVEADTVIFGHVHRGGPLDGDILPQWRGIGGTPRILNTGCWVYEPLLVRHARPPHHYWPGSAVLIEDGDARVVALLDHLSHADLHPPGTSS
jgi:UDP-2,3-diacylglucosamine pyrophosphatase LpxH